MKILVTALGSRALGGETVGVWEWIADFEAGQEVLANSSKKNESVILSVNIYIYLLTNNKSVTVF